MKLTLGFSTVRDKLDGLLAYLCKLELHSNCEIVVVAQGFDADSVEVVQGVGLEILLIRNKAVGLSISRNVVINSASGEFIWFLDDDVSIVLARMSKIVEQLSYNSEDVFIGQIACSDCPGLYKDYSRVLKGVFLPLRTSSIEVIVRRSFLLRSGISFDSRLGLGAKYPAGEENAFLLDLFKCRAKFYLFRFPIVKHPCLIDARKPEHKWLNANVLVARGIVARRCGVYSPLVLAYFIVQTVFITKSLFKVRSLVKGFFRIGL